MREILFRGKQKNNGEWVEGFYVMHSASIGHPYSYTDGKHCIQTVPHNIQYEVDPETVCQYTGLTDNEGRKIFEGDIVEVPDDDELYVIKWDEDTAKYALFNMGSAMSDFDNYWGHEIKVIGNIFDNPRTAGGGK